MTRLELWERIVSRRAVVGVLAVGIALVTVGGWVGLSAQRARGRLAVDAARLEGEVARLDRWQREFRPVSLSEAAGWRPVEASLASLGVAPSEQVTLAHAVARAAEEAGFTEVRVRFTTRDSGQVVAQRPDRLGRRTLQPASYGLSMNARGSYEGLVRLIGALPPSVAVWRVTAMKDGGAVAYTRALAVFEAVESNE